MIRTIAATLVVALAAFPAHAQPTLSARDTTGETRGVAPVGSPLMGERTPAATGAQRLAFWGANSLPDLNATLVGRGIEGTAVPAATATQGGEILWVSYRDYTDDLGMRHVFYRQHFRPAGYLASLLEANYQTGGVEMAGGTVGVHYNHGTL